VVDLGLGGDTLQRTNEHCGVDTSVGQVGNGTEKRHVQAPELWVALLLGFAVPQGGVVNETKVLGILDLVERNFHSAWVLNVSDPAVGEVLLLDLQLAKNLTDLVDDELDFRRLTGDLQVVDVLAHQGFELAIAVKHAEFRIHLAFPHVAVLFRDLLELEGESARCINKPCPWFVAVKNLNLGVK
jgi:hypothetical protein